MLTIASFKNDRGKAVAILNWIFKQIVREANFEWFDYIAR
jgi:hypothetical protein